VSLRALGGGVALAVFVLDQAAKAAVLSRAGPSLDQPIPLLPFLDLALRWNRGISFSLFARDSPLAQSALLAVTVVAIAFLGLWLSRTRSTLAAIGLGAIIGGALGNAADRVAHGAVVDFLDLYAFGWHFFVFNLADAAINIGVALLALDMLALTRAPDGRSPTAPPPGPR